MSTTKRPEASEFTSCVNLDGSTVGRRAQCAPRVNLDGRSTSTDNERLARRGGEQAWSGRFQRDDVLDPDAGHAGQIDPRLDAEDHAGLEGGCLRLPQPGRLVRLQPDPVSEAVAVRLDPLGLDPATCDGIELLAVGTDGDRVDRRLLRLAHGIVV